MEDLVKKKVMHRKLVVRFYCSVCQKWKKLKRFPTSIDPVQPACIKCSPQQEETKIES